MKTPAQRTAPEPNRLAPVLVVVALCCLAAKPAPPRQSEGVELDPSKPAEAAILDAKKKLELDPASAEAHVELGNAFFERGWIRDAMAEFEAAAELEPEYSVAWNNHAIVAEMIGESQVALESLKHAVKADDFNAEAHFNLGRLFERRRDFDGAVEHYIKALRLRPELGDPLRNPRAKSSKLLLNAKLMVYRAVTSGSLPPLGPGGESGLARLIASPGALSSLGGTDLSAKPSPTPAPSPTPMPTPIVLGPGSVPPSAATGGQPPPGDSPGRGGSGGRGIRRGGPTSPPRPSGDEQ